MFSLAFDCCVEFCSRATLQRYRNTKKAENSVKYSRGMGGWLNKKLNETLTVKCSRSGNWVNKSKQVVYKKRLKESFVIHWNVLYSERFRVCVAACRVSERSGRYKNLIDLFRCIQRERKTEKTVDRLAWKIDTNCAIASEMTCDLSGSKTFTTFMRKDLLSFDLQQWLDELCMSFDYRETRYDVTKRDKAENECCSATYKVVNQPHQTDKHAILI